MPIEFRCQKCGKLLRTGDDTAGKQARCPECGTISPIPEIGTPAASPGNPFAPLPSSASPFPAPASPFASSGEPPSAESFNPYQAPTSERFPQQIGSALVAGPIVPTRLELNEVLSRSWKLYREKLFGPAIAVVLIQSAINYACQFGGAFAVHQIEAAGAGGAAQVFQLIFSLFTMSVQIMLGAGQTRFFLRAAREGQGEVGELFSGAPYFWRFLGATILLGLMSVGLAFALIGAPAGIAFAVGGKDMLPVGAGIGALLLAVPIMILALMFCEFQNLIVDQNLGVFDSLAVSRQITAGNRGTLFLLFLLFIPINLVGVLACCIGVLFTAPYCFLVLTMAYLTMIGAYRTPQDMPSA